MNAITETRFTRVCIFLPKSEDSATPSPRISRTDHSCRHMPGAAPAGMFEELGALEVYGGTKGGRPRLVPIKMPEQADVIAWVKCVAVKSPSGGIRWPEHSWMQAQRRFYYLMKKLGLTRRELGVTAHGLRHDKAQATYRSVTGKATPIEGADPKCFDRQSHWIATLKTSGLLGHGRPAVTTYYIGSHGHIRNLVSPQTAWAVSNWQTPGLTDGEKHDPEKPE